MAYHLEPIWAPVDMVEGSSRSWEDTPTPVLLRMLSYPHYHPFFKGPETTSNAKSGWCFPEVPSAWRLTVGECPGSQVFPLPFARIWPFATSPFLMRQLTWGSFCNRKQQHSSLTCDENMPRAAGPWLSTFTRGHCMAHSGSHGTERPTQCPCWRLSAGPLNKRAVYFTCPFVFHCGYWLGTLRGG